MGLGPMGDRMTIHELTETVRNLDALLSDPRPGLVSWHAAIASLVDGLISRWHQPYGAVMHIDGDPRNNHPSNLRVVNPKENRR